MAEQHQIYHVELAMGDMTARTPVEAAIAFLEALVSADWSSGCGFSVVDGDGHVHNSVLTHDQVQAALNWTPPN